jgi:hypothetical protein
MKKPTALMALLFVLCFFALAESAERPAAPHADKGDLIADAGILYGWYGFGAGGGIEYIFATWEIPRFTSLGFGAAAKASFGYPGLAADLSALATLHFGLKGFSTLPRFLRNFDFYWGLGLGACLGSYFGAGPALATGISYFISPGFAINADFYAPYYLNLGAAGYTAMIGAKWKI